jgi:integrase
LPNRTVTLGTPESLSPDAARAAAGRFKGEAKAGRDPVAERKIEAVARRAAAAETAFTFAYLVEAWANARKGDRRDSYLTVATASLKRHFAGWLSRPAASITLREAVQALDRIKSETGPTAANRALAYGRAAYSWAVKRQLVGNNPLGGVERPGRETARERLLTAEEVAAIYRAADSLSKPYDAFMRVLLLTLQRREEVAAMRWAELSPDLATWTLPGERAKNRKAHIIHLSEPVRAILGAMKRLEGCPYVFPAEGKLPASDAPWTDRKPAEDVRSITAFSGAKRKLDETIAKVRREADPKTTALPGWTMHDFRRAGVTALAGMGFAPHVCDRLLNHITGSIQGVAAVYQRNEFLSERKAALEAWAVHVLAAAEGRTPHGNVVPMMARVG